jgi:solute:Na+ symporter, SSS family
MIGTVVIPGLLVPLVSSYFERWKPDARTAFAAMMLGWLVSLGWLVAGWTHEMGSSDYFPFGIEPMYPGLGVSSIVWGVGLLRGRSRQSFRGSA